MAKSDQESAIKSPVDEMGRQRSARGGGLWVVERGPVGSSASNGTVERAL